MAIPPMDRNLKELLSALNAYSVRYVVIGGYAVFIHAQPRMTKDLDVFIESSPTNAVTTFKALAAFGAPLQGFTVKTSANRPKSRASAIRPSALSCFNRSAA